MPLDGLEDLVNAGGRGPRAGAAFRIQGQGFDPLTGHGLTQFALQQRLHQEHEEVDCQQALNAAPRLSNARGRRRSPPHLGEPLLDERLSFVRPQHLLGAQLSVVGQQGEDAVPRLSAAEGERIQFPRQMVARTSLFSVLGVLTRTAGLSFEAARLAHTEARNATPGQGGSGVFCMTPKVTPKEPDMTERQEDCQTPRGESFKFRGSQRNGIFGGVRQDTGELVLFLPWDSLEWTMLKIPKERMPFTMF